MILLLVLVFALYLGYRSMDQGLPTIMGRCAMGALAIATGVGFAGPLRQVIPLENDYLFGLCFVVISLFAYMLQRGITSYYLLEREIILPEYIDRFGSVLFGFVGGLMLGGFICLSVLTFPLPPLVEKIRPEIARSASFAEGTVRLIGAAAGKGDLFTNSNKIFLREFLPQPDEAPVEQAPKTDENPETKEAP